MIYTTKDYHWGGFKQWIEVTPEEWDLAEDREILLVTDPDGERRTAFVKAVPPRNTPGEERTA